MKRALQAPGTKLETLALASARVNLPGTPARLRVGQVRYVNKADTTGVYLKEEGDDSPTRGSFLGYDKASDWQIEGDIITSRWGMSYRVILEGASK
jgi:hypothetical protein